MHYYITVSNIKPINKEFTTYGSLTTSLLLPNNASIWKWKTKIPANKIYESMKSKKMNLEKNKFIRS